MFAHVFHQKVYALLNKYLAKLNNVATVKQSKIVQELMADIKVDARYISLAPSGPLYASRPYEITETEKKECKRKAKLIMGELSKACKQQVLKEHMNDMYMSSEQIGYFEQSLLCVTNNIQSTESEFKYKLRML